jgi:hypothetical protein
MNISEKQAYRIRYLVLPDFVFQNEKLSYLAAKLYAFIHGYRAPEFFFSNEKLAELFNCDERSIRRAISQLREEGYIECEQPNGRKRYITDLWVDTGVLPGGTQMSSHLQADGGTEMSSANVPNEGSNRRENGGKAIPNKNISNKNNLAKIGEDEIEVNEKGVMLNPKTGIPYTGKQLKAMKQNNGWGGGRGRGFSPNAGSAPRYEKKERTGVHAEDVV